MTTMKRPHGAAHRRRMKHARGPAVLRLGQASTQPRRWWRLESRRGRRLSCPLPRREVLLPLRRLGPRRGLLALRRRRKPSQRGHGGTIEALPADRPCSSRRRLLRQTRRPPHYQRPLTTSPRSFASALVVGPQLAPVLLKQMANVRWVRVPNATSKRVQEYLKHNQCGGPQPTPSWPLHRSSAMRACSGSPAQLSILAHSRGLVTARDLPRVRLPARATPGRR